MTLSPQTRFFEGIEEHANCAVLPVSLSILTSLPERNMCSPSPFKNALDALQEHPRRSHEPSHFEIGQQDVVSGVYISFLIILV